MLAPGKMISGLLSWRSTLKQMNHSGIRTTEMGQSAWGLAASYTKQDGFCVAKAPAYYLELKQKNGQWITNWADFAHVNFPGTDCSSYVADAGLMNWAGGYAANARAMLAAAASVNIPNAATAYALWKSKTPLVEKDFSNNPTWAIAPRTN